MFAVVRTGGKQYRVREGRPIKIERLPGDVGSTIELGDVLLLGEGDAITVGAPTISGARVVGTIAEQGRSKKIIVFRYKAKTRARKKNGHRQPFTMLMVDDILGPGQQPKPKQAAAAAEPEAAPAPKGRRGGRKTAAAVVEPAASVSSDDDATVTAPADATPEAPATPAAPARRRLGRKKAE